MLRTLLAVIAAWLTLGTTAAQADYWGRWDRVGGGWTTGWIRHNGNANVCGHGHNGCVCGGRNFCGTYPNGAETIWCPNGANRPPAWRIRCSIRPISGPGGPGGPGGHNTRIFNRPRMNGAIVDWCSTWATNCGRGGANLFCQRAGYTHAVNWATYRPGRTWVIGSNRMCVGGFCTGFSHVTCRR